MTATGETLKPVTGDHWLYRAISLGVPALIGGRQKCSASAFTGAPRIHPFGSNERRTLERLTDSLRLKAENLALHDSVLRMGAVNDALSHAAGIGWVMLDDSLRLVDANDAGLSALSHGAERSRVLAALSIYRAEASVRTHVGRPLELFVSGRSSDVSMVSVTSLRGADREIHWLLQWRRDRQAKARTALLLRAQLPPQERQVVELLAAGHNNPGAARLMEISVQTVDNYLRSVFAKLGVSSRTQMLGKLLSI